MEIQKHRQTVWQTWSKIMTATVSHKLTSPFSLPSPPFPHKMYGRWWEDPDLDYFHTMMVCVLMMSCMRAKSCKCMCAYIWTHSCRWMHVCAHVSASLATCICVYVCKRSIMCACVSAQFGVRASVCVVYLCVLGRACVYVFASAGTCVLY